MKPQIEHEIILPCTPQESYDTWMDSKKHGEMVGAKAVISKRVGGIFDIWEDYLIGKTLELHPKTHTIVQSWRDNSSEWPEGQYSTITLQFSVHDKHQTKLMFTQTGIPDKYVADIEQGWKDFYWSKMKDYFSKN